VAASAAVALRFAMERRATCQQGRCQQANHSSHWVFHHSNRKEHATTWQKAHYFLTPGLYSGWELVLEAAEGGGCSWYPG
jgi:hypothetical protein